MSFFAVGAIALAIGLGLAAVLSRRTCALSITPRTLFAIAVAHLATPVKGQTLVRWYTGVKGQNCDTVCGTQIEQCAVLDLACVQPSGALTSNSLTQMNKVNSVRAFMRVMDAIVADQGAGAGLTCASYRGNSGIDKQVMPMFNSHSRTCYYRGAPGAASTTCSAVGPSSGINVYDRLCCCPAPGEDAATVCPVSASDCGANTVWNTTTSRCLRCPASGAAVAGAWSDGTLCGSCPVGKYGAESGRTSEAAACTGAVATCPHGTYGASLSDAGMTACANCSVAHGATPAGSMYCASAALVRWYTTETADQSCDDICGAKVVAGTTCDATRQNAVSSPTTLIGVMNAITADRGVLPAQWRTSKDGVWVLSCLEYKGSSSTSYGAPNLDTRTQTCYFNTAAKSTCWQSVGSRASRLCCCPAPGEDAATVCAVRASDCGANTVWDTATSRCLRCPASGAAVAGAWSDGTLCGSCPVGRYGAESGRTSEAAACTGYSHTCPRGTYGASLSDAGMTACANCPGENDSTPAGSRYCNKEASALVRWYTGRGLKGTPTGYPPQQGFSCDAVCASTPQSGTCNATRMRAVNSEAKMKGVMAAIAADGKTWPGKGLDWTCDGYGTPHSNAESSPSAYWNTFSSSTQCYFIGSGPSSTCDATYSEHYRLCCCPAAGEEPSTVCPVSAADCAAGFAWDPDTSRCSRDPCALGAYNANTLDAAECTPCSAGKWSATNGIMSDAQCELCSAGKHGNDTTGLSAADECVECAPGRYAPTKGSPARCGAACGIGKYSTTAGATTEAHCSACHPTAVALSGASACFRCGGGRVGDTLRAQCIPCPAGKRKQRAPLGEAFECGDCPPHSVALSGSDNCTQCTVGAFPNDAQAVCVRCPANTYHALDGSCSSCPRIGVLCEDSVVQISSNFWLPPPPNASAFTMTPDTILYPCASIDACLSAAPGSVVVECNAAAGYFGPLCGACDRNNKLGRGEFTRSGRTCAKCWGDGLNSFSIACLLVGIVVAAVVVTLRNTRRRVGEYGGILRRMAFSYIQMLGMLGIFKARGTKVFNDAIGKSSQVAGGALTAWMPIKCMLKSDAVAPFILNLLLPALFAVLVIAILIPTTLIMRRAEKRARASQARQAVRRERFAQRDSSYVFASPSHEPVVDLRRCCGGFPTKVELRIPLCRRSATEEYVANALRYFEGRGRLPPRQRPLLQIRERELCGLPHAILLSCKRCRVATTEVEQGAWRADTAVRSQRLSHFSPRPRFVAVLVLVMYSLYPTLVASTASMLRADHPDERASERQCAPNPAQGR